MTRPWISLLLAGLACTQPLEIEPPPEPTESDELAFGRLADPGLAPATHTAQGHTAHVLHDNRHVAVVDPGQGRLLLVDATMSFVSVEQALYANEQPFQVTQDSVGRIWVTLRRSGRVGVFDSTTLEPLGELDVCASPRGIDAHQSDGSVWIACDTGELVHANATGVLDTVLVRPDLRDVVIEEHTNTLWVSVLRSASVLEVELDTSLVRAEHTLPGTTTITQAGDEIEFVGRVGWRMVAGPKGGVYLAGQRHTNMPLNIDDIPDDIDVPDPDEPPPYYGPPELSCMGIIHPVVAHASVDQRSIGSIQPMTKVSGVLSGVSLPIDLAFDGTRLLVASAGAHPDATSSFAVASYRSYDAGRGCTAGEVVRTADFEVVTTVLPLPQGSLLTVSEQPFTVRIDGRRIDGGGWVDASAFQLFHQATPGATVSCASCHPDGHEDGHTWNFSTIGPRRTQALGGGILDTAPYHWDGDLRDLSELMTTVFEGRMGGVAIEPESLAELGQWLHEIEPPASSTQANATHVERGRVMFEGRCASCHSGEQYTDTKSYDVGTGGLLQVPSLLGVSRRLPLMHDGCARTLAERFEPSCGGDAHGFEDRSDGTPTAQELTAMVAFLETL